MGRSKVSKSKKWHPDIEKAFKAWQDVTGYQLRKLSDYRRRKIHALLKVYPLEDLKLIFSNLSRSEHHRGRYDDFVSKPLCNPDFCDVWLEKSKEQVLEDERQQLSSMLAQEIEAQREADRARAEQARARKLAEQQKAEAEREYWKAHPEKIPEWKPAWRRPASNPSPMIKRPGLPEPWIGG